MDLAPIDTMIPPPLAEPPAPPAFTVQKRHLDPGHPREADETAATLAEARQLAWSWCFAGHRREATVVDAAGREVGWVSRGQWCDSHGYGVAS